MNEIVKEYISLDIDTLAKAYKLHYEERHPIVSKLFIILAISLIIISIPLFYLYFKNEKGDIVLPTLMFLLSLYYTYKSFTLYKSAAKKSIKIKKGIDELDRYRIDSEGFTVESKEHVSNYKWNRFGEAIITKDFILLYDTMETFRVFSHKSYSSDEFEQIKLWVKSKCKLI